MSVPLGARGCCGWPPSAPTFHPVTRCLFSGSDPAVRVPTTGSATGLKRASVSWPAVRWPWTLTVLLAPGWRRYRPPVPAVRPSPDWMCCRRAHRRSAIPAACRLKTLIGPRPGSGVHVISGEQWVVMYVDMGPVFMGRTSTHGRHTPCRQRDTSGVRGCPITHLVDLALVVEGP